jgi:ADP-ribose pyrophosphatase YjhB (NUDIX family)
MKLKEAISAIDNAASDSRQGLPEELFLLVSRLSPLINVDLLIQNSAQRTLLTWRNDEYFQSGWHLPGGIIRYKERAADRIQKCAAEELGVQVRFDPEPVTIIETIQQSRNRGHFISLLYRCMLLGDPLEDLRASENPLPGQWRWHAGCPENLIAVQKLYCRFF